MKLLQIHEPGESPLPHEDAAAVGIDLGTTHSVVAVGTEEGPQVIRNARGEALIPSAVWMGSDGAILTGTAAKQKQWRGESGVVTSVKRLMGRGIQDVASIRGSLPYEIAPGSEKGVIRLRIGAREVTPVEISAEILKTMKRMAEDALGRSVTRAVITVPAYFDDAARHATKDAAKLAGLEVLRLVNEPTAAALAYGLDKNAEGIYAVYDLGGGTFDLSLLKLTMGVFQVLATGGDTALGGDDLDRALLTHAAEKARVALPELTREQIGALLQQARQARETLSEAPSVTLTVAQKAIDVDRAGLEKLMAPWIDKTMDVCAQVLQDAGLTPRQIKGVVLVGGTTRTPLVRRRVGEFFGQNPLTDVNPDEVVALGAALQAEGISHGSGNLLLDVIPLSLGIETMGGLAEKILPRNTPIPVSVSQEFTTWQDRQTGMQINIIQGEREMAVQNRSLARFELTGIPPMTAGMARVRVTYAVDADGLLTVSAEETLTGIRQSIEVIPSYGLSADAMERMLIESMEHARQDITGRLLVEARVEAERTLQEIKQALEKDRSLLLPDEMPRIEASMEAVRKTMTGNDRGNIDAATQALHHAVADFAQRRMDRAITAALKGKHVDSIAQPG